MVSAPSRCHRDSRSSYSTGPGAASLIDLLSPPPYHDHAMLEQFIPKGFCIECDGCCRFAEPSSVWTPCLLSHEARSFLDQGLIGPERLSPEGRLLALEAGGDSCPCPFLDLSGNACRIYEARPIECQLYPFLLSRRQGRLFLAVDPHCPYVHNREGDVLGFARGLAASIAPLVPAWIRDNPHLPQPYDQAEALMELEGDVDAP